MTSNEVLEFSDTAAETKKLREQFEPGTLFENIKDSSGFSIE
jgi:hypothetical protein